MFDVLAIISVLIVMMLLKTIVSIFPYIMGSLLRWKESINIESSVPLSRDRDMAAIAMLLPFCLCAYKFKIYDPGFITNIPDGTRIWVIIGIFVTYLLIRMAIAMMIQPRKIGQKTYAASRKSAYSFFVILTLAVLLVGSIASFFDVSANSIRTTAICLSALIYGLYLIRKVQILASSCSIFTAFLYLCALEILPTGILIISDVIL